VPGAAAEELELEEVPELDPEAEVLEPEPEAPLDPPTVKEVVVRENWEATDDEVVTVMASEVVEAEETVSAVDVDSVMVEMPEPVAVAVSVPEETVPVVVEVNVLVSCAYAVAARATRAASLVNCIVGCLLRETWIERVWRWR